MSPPQQANDLTKRRDAAPAAVLLDPQSKIARAYGATVTPHMYIIDANGILVYKGGINSIPSANIADIAKAKQYVRVGLDEVLAGKPVSRLVDPALRLLAEVPAHLDLTSSYAARRLASARFRRARASRARARSPPQSRPADAAARSGGNAASVRLAPARRPSTPPNASPSRPTASSAFSTTASGGRC